MDSHNITQNDNDNIEEVQKYISEVISNTPKAINFLTYFEKKQKNEVEDIISVINNPLSSNTKQYQLEIKIKKDAKQISKACYYILKGNKHTKIVIATYMSELKVDPKASSSQKIFTLQVNTEQKFDKDVIFDYVITKYILDTMKIEHNDEKYLEAKELLNRTISTLVLFTNLALYQKNCTNDAYNNLSSPKNDVLEKYVQDALKEIAQNFIKNHTLEADTGIEKVKKFIETTENDMHNRIPGITYMYIYHVTKKNIIENNKTSSIHIYYHIFNAYLQEKDAKSIYSIIGDTKLIAIPLYILLNTIIIEYNFTEFVKNNVNVKDIECFQNLKPAIKNVLGKQYESCIADWNDYNKVNYGLEFFLDKSDPKNVKESNLIKLLKELETTYPGLISFMQIQLKPTTGLTPKLNNIEGAEKDKLKIIIDKSYQHIEAGVVNDIPDIKINAATGETFTKNLQEAKYLDFFKRNPLSFIMLFILSYSLIKNKNSDNISASASRS
ncbi:hypothetical protein M896_140010 [Ordospora colligata OC4]|uniref:Uncharacterized protein n=1 Tax=Ordospora colligata OC4 TaxID=1354746 RepID=A0A0B2UIC8_9MICR|nr:uncharacterized protein M896_140010 [Ordospora colligata OC4]KHN68777.1 hypothetical protein M896_140010 [Ordospora colligata OC4]TBU13769.1 hypothetical protein CWI41_140010 [Ordospora colligata]